MSVEYRVPRVLWENLEAVLLAQSKRYVGELAKLLHVSEKDLLKQVLPRSDSIQVLIQDGEYHPCRAYVQQDTLTIQCRKAVAYQSEFCAFHRTKRAMLIEQVVPCPITKVKDQAAMEPMWVMGHTILHSQGHLLGTICPSEQRLRIFVLPQEIPLKKGKHASGSA